MPPARRLHQRLDAGTEAPRGVVISIASGKGGVGKTNLALNLGIQLSRRGLATLLVDADFELANADILLNVAPRGDLADVLRNGRDLNELLADGPDGLRLLCGSSGLAHAASSTLRPGDYERALARLRGHAAYILVDCGSGLHPRLLALAQAGDHLVLVTTPEPTALADSYGTLKYLVSNGFEGRVGVVVNMAGSRAEADDAARRLGRVARQFLGRTVEPLGFIPFDRHVPLAVRARVPLVVHHPHCAASIALDRLCERFGPCGGSTAAPPGVWSRLASLFL